MTEILFCCAPEACLPVHIKLDLIIETLQKIFGKVSLNQAMPETAVLISGTILLLLINLRYCCSQNIAESGAFYLNNIEILKVNIVYNYFYIRYRAY